MEHVQGKRAFIQSRDRRPLAPREPIKQSSNFPVIEHAPLVTLLMTREDVERLHFVRRDQLQHSRLSRSQTGRVARKLFQGVDDTLAKQRLKTQIRFEEVEPSLRRRRAIGLVRTTGQFEVI